MEKNADQKSQIIKDKRNKIFQLIRDEQRKCEESGRNIQIFNYILSDLREGKEIDLEQDYKKHLNSYQKTTLRPLLMQSTSEELLIELGERMARKEIILAKSLTEAGKMLLVDDKSDYRLIFDISKANPDEIFKIDSEDLLKELSKRIIKGEIKIDFDGEQAEERGRIIRYLVVEKIENQQEYKLDLLEVGGNRIFSRENHE